MPIKTLVPAIAFNGTCAGAIALYQRALDARVENLVHFRDGAKMGHPFDPALADRVLNATLRLGGGSLMVMDAPPDRPVPAASNVQVSVELSDVASLEAAFHALAEGGHVGMPPHDAFWGARFAMVTDAFGVGWMLGHTRATPA